ncbi:hypothetical protein ACFL2R_02135 [Patescibacteria group bacterium]
MKGDISVITGKGLIGVAYDCIKGVSGPYVYMDDDGKELLIAFGDMSSILLDLVTGKQFFDGRGCVSIKLVVRQLALPGVSLR